MKTPKQLLIEELSVEPVNVLRIRRLCLENPGNEHNLFLYGQLCLKSAVDILLQV